jgi:inhibitor of the pro-sigma K processing machinery
MAFIGILVLLLVILAFAAVVYYVVRNIGHLVINSIVGLLTLFLVNYFHVMQYAGKPDIGVGWITVIICALAGLPGAILVMILALFGITL